MYGRAQSEGMGKRKRASKDEVQLLREELAAVKAQLGAARARFSQAAAPITQERIKPEVRNVSPGAPSPEAAKFLRYTGSCSKGRVLLLGTPTSMFNSEIAQITIEADHMILMAVGNTVDTEWTAQEEVAVTMDTGQTIDCEVVAVDISRRRWVCLLEPLDSELKALYAPDRILWGSVAGDVTILGDRHRAITATVDGEHRWCDGPLPIPGAAPGDLVLIPHRFSRVKGSYECKAVVMDATPDECVLLYADYGWASGFKSCPAAWYLEKYPERKIDVYYPHAP